MSTIKGIFEPFYDYVQKQLNRRKEILGYEAEFTGDPTEHRSRNIDSDSGSAFFKLVTEKQCVVRMASGVDLKPNNNILEKDGDEDYLLASGKYGNYSGLARQYVLEGGTQFQYIFSGSYEGFGGEHGGTREGFAQHGLIDTHQKGHTYGDINVRGNTKDGYGIVPMPGITDAQINTKSEDGSLREATVNFVCFNRRQLQVLETLYMRPGYPVLLEWGWTPFINNKGEIENDEFGFIEEFWDPKSDLNTMNRSIRKQKEISGGNYDGFIGYIKNFAFKAREDGGFDCVTELIAHGELLEALQVPSRLVTRGLTYDSISGLTDNEWNQINSGNYNIRKEYEAVDEFLYLLKSIKNTFDRAGDEAQLRLEGTDKHNVRMKVQQDDPSWWKNVRIGTRNMLSATEHEATEWVTYKYVDSKNRPIDVTKLNQWSEDFVEGFDEVKKIAAEILKLPDTGSWDEHVNEMIGLTDLYGTQFNVDRHRDFTPQALDELYSAESALPSDNLGPQTDYLDNPQARDMYDKEANKYRWDVGGSGDALQAEKLFGSKLGFYSLMNGLILKEIVAGRENTDSDNVDSGYDKRVFIRWDLLCQLLNQKAIGHYQENTPLSELTYLHPNQPTYDPKSTTKVDNIEKHPEHSKGYSYIRYSVPEVLPKLFPGDGGPLDKKYPPMLGCSFDPSICIMPHQIPQLRFQAWEGHREDKKSDIEPGDENWEKETGNFTSFTKVESDIHSIGHVYLNLDHLIKNYESLLFEEYNTDVSDEKKVRRRKKKVFNLHDYITTIWNDVNKACGGYYDFGVHTEHERPHVARILDFTLSGRPPVNIFEFDPQGLNSISRQNFFSSKLDNDFAASISIAAQAPDNIDSLESLSFKAFRKGIKSRFTLPQMSREERWKMIREAGKEYEEDLKRYGDTLYSLGFYLKKLGQSNYKSEIVYKSGEDGGMEPDYTRTPLSAEQAKRLAANIEEQRVKIAARYPRYQEDGMTPFFTVNEKNKSNNVEANAWYEGNAGDENNFSKTKLQSLNYKGQFREQSTHYRSAIIPLTSNITLDGIAGIVPLQLYKINPEKLPLGYQGDDVAFVVKSESQKITSGQDWTTTIQGNFTLLNIHSNTGDNNLKGENDTSPELNEIDEDVQWYANQLRALMDQHGHIEKIYTNNLGVGSGELDSNGDIDPIIVEFMEIFFKELDAVDEDGNSKWFKDFPDCPSEPPFQQLYFTAGNDLHHASSTNSYHNANKRKDGLDLGLAVDFRLVSGMTKEGTDGGVFPGSNVYHSSYANSSGHDNYAKMSVQRKHLEMMIKKSSLFPPADGYQIMTLDDLNETQLAQLSNSVGLGDPINRPDLTNAYSDSNIGETYTDWRGAVVDGIIKIIRTEYPQFVNLQIIDHYKDHHADHYHLEFDPSQIEVEQLYEADIPKPGDNNEFAPGELEAIWEIINEDTDGVD